MDTKTTCKECDDKDIKITALERVMGKLERGIDGFNWVGHEIGLRKKIREIESKHQRAITRYAKMIADKKQNQRDDCNRKDEAIQRWKDNFHKIRREQDNLKSHWLIGTLMKWFKIYGHEEEEETELSS